MIKHIYVVITVMMLDILTTTVFSATVKNTDLKAQSFTIAEGSTFSTISLNNNQTVTVCLKGCFIIFPNKDHFAITAEDNIEINEGRAIFK
ncbi:hypothetical protein V4P56_03530 [Bartonella sp. B35(2025)]